MDRFENRIDVIQGKRLDKGFEINLAIQDQIHGGGVVFGKATPIAFGRGMERHEIGQTDLDFRHGKSHHREMAAKGHQTERGLLARR